MVVPKNLSEKERFNFFYKSIQKDGKIMYAGAILRRAYQEFPDNTALIYKDRFVSYKELYYLSILFAKKLKQKGIKSRDRVLIFYRNSLEFYVAYFAVWQIGAIVAPLNIYLKEKELRHIVNDSQASLVITSSDKVDFFSGEHISPTLTEKDMDLEVEVPKEIPDIEIPDFDSNELAALLYTSGTTGLPKAVMLSSKNIMTNVAQILARMPFSETKKVFCVLPLFHCFAQNTCIWSSLFSGSTVIVVPKISRKEILDGLKHKPSIFLGVPALFGLLCLFKNAPLDCVEYFVSGGDALPDKIRAFFSLLYGRKLCNGYGLTETSPLVAVDMEDVTEPTSNIGRPVEGVQCVIKDDDGHTLANGEIGELWIRGDNVMLGYYNAPEKTKEVLVDGWLVTGDLAKYDKHGKLIICGRLKDLIIHKGLNIYPQEIENVISKYPAVLRVGVIGLDEDSYGKIPVAVVQLRVKDEKIEEKLRALCKNELAGYKIPRKFIFVKDMPVTATGKVDKNRLIKQVLK